MVICEQNLLQKIINPIKVRNVCYSKPIKGFSIDSRSIKKGEAFIALKGKHYDGHDFIQEALNKGASLIISQKDIPLIRKVPNFIVDCTYDSLKYIVKYIRKIKKITVVAITGSVGKTTTKEMISFLLEEKYKTLKSYKNENNILGVAKTFFSLKDEDILVIELGTNKKGEIRELSEIVYPDVGVITFVKPVHLEGLKNLKGVFEEKSSLLRVNPNIKAVLNGDDPYLSKINFCKEIYWFGKNKNNNLYGRLIKQSDKTSTFLIQDKYHLSLETPFNGFIYNALAAILSAHLFNIPLETLINRMNNFVEFPSLRMQMEEIGGFLIFNDAYNANPYSFSESLKLLRKFNQKKIIVVGDMLELGSYTVYYHRLLAHHIAKCNFNYCLAMGDYTPYSINELKRLGYNNVFHFSSHKDIANFIKKKAKKGWLIFLKGSRKLELEKIITLLKYS